MRDGLLSAEQRICPTMPFVITSPKIEEIPISLLTDDDTVIQYLCTRSTARFASANYQCFILAQSIGDRQGSSGEGT